MIYITGDIHGDPSRFSRRKLQRYGLTLKAEDYVIICGDFGLLWRNPPSKEETYWLNWLEQQPYTVLFVDGNHENFAMLNAFPAEKYGGGLAQRIRRNVLHLRRGEIFHLEGHSFFCFGGATSTDIDGRRPFVSWWPEEVPSKLEYENALVNLAKVNNQVDYVLTHTLPERSLQARLRKMPSVFMDDCQVRKMLDDLANHMSYKAWFAGHLHENYMDVENRCYWLFDRIVSISPENMVSILPIKKHLPK